MFTPQGASPGERRSFSSCRAGREPSFALREYSLTLSGVVHVYGEASIARFIADGRRIFEEEDEQIPACDARRRFTRFFYYFILFFVRV